MSVGKIVALAAGGGAGLLFLGIFIAWAVKSKPHHADGPSPAPARQVAVQPVSNNPPATVAGVIQADQAAKYINQRCTVEMFVVRAAKAGTAERYFLNTKQDYRAADNFTVTFTKATLDQLIPKGITNVSALENKTIRVTGVIILYNNLPQIEVNNADQIQVVNR